MGKRQLLPSKSPQELLTEFRNSGSQEPFEEIVRRYAGMVYSVCLRVTHDSHDAEDATQAVFLSLALQAKTSRPIFYLGPWLQRVAHRLALDIKKSKTRRRRREEKLLEMNGNNNGRHIPDPSAQPRADELKHLINEELSAMPAKYRMPLILHYFGGMSRDEIARELGCKPATLGVRVHRGRAMLTSRLKKRGIVLGALSLGAAVVSAVKSAVTDPMITQVASSAAGLLASNDVAIHLASSRVMALVRTALRATLLAKIRIAVAIMLVTGLTGALAGPNAMRALQSLEWRLGIPLDFRQWIKPLLRSILLEPQAQVIEPARLQLDLPPDVFASQPTPSRNLWSRDDSSPDRPLAISLPSLDTMYVPPVRLQAPAPAPAPVSFSLQPGPPVSVWTGPARAPVVASNVWAAPGATASSDGSGNPATFMLGQHPASVERHVLRDGQTLRVRDSVIGGSGFGHFRQTGGSHLVERRLTLGLDPEGHGLYEMTGGTLVAAEQLIGDHGTGEFHHTDGHNTAATLVLGNEETGYGSYVLSGNGVLTGGQIVVGARGTGEISQSGGTIVVDPAATPDKPQGPPIIMSPGMVALGAAPTGKGTFALTDGEIVFERSEIRPALGIGLAGMGTFVLGDDRSTGKITEALLAKTSLVVRAQDRGQGVLRGWGEVELTGTLVNNGQVIADGFDLEHTLDLSRFSRVRSNIENPIEGGTLGWFAERKGALRLPPIHVRRGTGAYNWGESPTDPEIDLINSVRLIVHEATYPGEVAIMLLSPDRSDIPALPKGHTFLAVWSFDPSDIDAEGFDLTVRYDDVLAASLDLKQELLKLWVYDNGWGLINDGNFVRDMERNYLSGSATSFTFFAVSAPEPSAIAGLIFTAGVLLRRRRT